MPWWRSTKWAATADCGTPRCAPIPSSITKKDLERNAKNLDYFDALVFVSTTGELDLDDSQKKDMMSFIHDDGKGFVGFMRRSTRITNGQNMAR